MQLQHMLVRFLSLSVLANFQGRGYAEHAVCTLVSRQELRCHRVEWM
jgi:hypothetical protein